MRVFRSFEEANGKLNNAVVTIGSFDGVHIGHKAIIKRLNKLSEQFNGESVLVTFHPHPRKILYPEQKDLKLINSQKEKIDLLEKAGLKNLIIISFTLEFSKTTSNDFIVKYILEKLNAKVVVVGHNHHFGHNREGNYDYLYKLADDLDFQVEEIPMQDIENEIVSSTKIRKALHEGNMQRANAYLDHHYIISGPIRLGEKMPGLNIFDMLELIIEEQEKLIPPPGIYAVNLFCNDLPMKGMAVIIKTCQGQKVYINLLNDALHDNQENVVVYFYKTIRICDLQGDDTSCEDEIKEAREEIDELIY